jgi:uncharacterized phage infection (PIP) family protein YhgE
MAEQNVVIKIQADVSKATNDVKALQQVIAKLSTSGTQAAAGTEKVGNAARKTATASQLLDKEIKKVVAGQGNLDKVADLATAALKEQELAAKRLAQVSSAVEQAVGKQGAAVLSGSKQIGGLADASGSASFALLSLGQAFQDSAQFSMGFAQGLRAVNNNVQQVFTAIALGSVQAGGFANFLKLMGGSLWGPGGLILGFSALSAGLEIFYTKSQQAESGVRSLSERTKALISISPLPGFEAGIVGLENVARAYEGLKREVDETLKQREQELILSKEQAKQADNSSSALIALGMTYATYQEQANKAKQESQDIADNLRQEAVQVSALESSYLRILKEIGGAEGVARQIQATSETRNQINAIIDSAKLLVESGIASVAQFNLSCEETNKILAELGSNVQLTKERFAELYGEGSIDEFIERQRERNAKESDLEKITRQLAEARDFVNSKDFEAIAIKELELDLAQQFADAQKQNIQLAALKASLEAGDETQLAITTAQITAIKGVNEGLREQVKLLLIKRGMTVEEIEGIFSSLGIAEDDVEKADQMTRAMERLNAAMARTAAQGIARVATGLLDVAIGGESFKDAILGPIADMAIQLGKIAIATGLTMEKLKFSFANPGSAIAAGVALVVAGKLVKSTISNASKSSASSAGVSSSRFSSPNAFSGAGNISNPMFSGAGILTPNNMVTVEVQGRLRGSDIYLSGRSETRSRSRMGVAG